MIEKTTQHNKLTRLIESIGSYECLEGIDIPPSHITPFLLQIQKRLDELETAILKMDSAFRTNPLTGDRTVHAIVQTLLGGRK